MYYMIRHNVLFRRYKAFGYLTDNSLFGYRRTGDEALFPGERYVSISGAVMLDELGKTPQHIDVIAQRLLKIYEDADLCVLKRDASDFFDHLVEDGFLSSGTTSEECLKAPAKKHLEKTNSLETTPSTSKLFDCLKGASQQVLLKSLHIELATQCNERCVHCYIPHKFKTKTIDSDLLFRLLDEARDLNVLNVTLSGGEPLLHKDFCIVLERLRELDMSVNVLSNLTLLTDEMVAEMARNPLLSVQTSIYSMSHETHDAITRVYGSLEKTLKSLKALKAAGIPVQISCPVMRQNKDSFAGVVAFGEQNEIHVSTDFVLFASYDHSGCNLNSRLSLDEIACAFDCRANDEYVRNLQLLAKEKERVGKDNPVCSICRYYMCISAEGMFYPCVGWQSKVIGDANHQSLKLIWEESDAVKYLRSIAWSDFPKCVSCSDKGFCNVCMMANANEDKGADPFRIGAYHCKVASLLHRKVELYERRNPIREKSN